MPVCRKNIPKAVKLLGKDHTRLLIKFAAQQDRLEEESKAALKGWFHELNAYAVNQLLEGKSLEDIDFEEFFMRHFYTASRLAIETAREEQSRITIADAKLSKAPPKAVIPRTLHDLQRLWDMWRTRGQLPKRQKTFADRIKKAYVKKCQDVWRKYTEEFREGVVADKAEALKVIQKASEGVYSRAKMIVETETTNYYNQTRKEIYDSTPVVTHYLFLAIRDQATTKWCTDQVRDGKRGRHGLVYEKDDELTKKETPACHWNCRSEMVPLTPFNPRHRKLIDNKKAYRRNNNCHPLPQGWNK